MKYDPNKNMHSDPFLYPYDPVRTPVLQTLFFIPENKQSPDIKEHCL